MINYWLLLALACMAADWVALWKARPSVNYLTKPLALLFLMLWFWSGAGAGWLQFCFLIGFFFSLIGDAFLLLPPRYFIAALAAFLLAHIGYLGGFIIGVQSLTPPFWILLIAVFLVILVFVRRLVPSVRENPRHRRMALPILLYAGVICLMVVFALWTLFRSDWGFAAAALASAGALLFLFSDLALAFDRFVRPLPQARLIVRVTYHLGQLALAAGAILQTTRVTLA